MNGLKTHHCGWCIAITILFWVANANGQSILTNPLKSHDIKYSLDSGRIYHDGSDRETVWSEEITVKGAMWLRLNFQQLVLAANPRGGASSTLKITSLSDGSFQLLDSKSALQWRNTSAYFNGGSVRLELIAAPNGRMNQIVVDQIVVGEFDGVSVSQTICGSVDDRELSDDPRNGRTAPGGCTGWLFDDRNNCMMTAGHCAPSTEVMLFNVPLSDANGNRQFPPPEDQYAVDFSSFQSVNGGVGNDWCYFGCFPNSNTGLTAFEAQGDSYEIAEPASIQPGDEIRITGYGSTSFPVDNTYNGAQKTHVGNYALFTNNELGYQTDTTGGNSGSPIIFEATGQAIGIHTHGGCQVNGGMNFGTGLLQAGVSAALDNPLGICAPNIDFTFPQGRPESITPDGTTVLQVRIESSDFELDSGTVMLTADTGVGFQDFPMVSIGSNLYEANFPSADCGVLVDYFVSISTVAGESFANPINAPTSSYTTITADDLLTIFADDFEIDMGWTVSGNANAGQWQRGVPVGGGDRGDPASDADGSGSCFVTENADGNSDIDAGSTTLTSPTLDASVEANQTAVLRYFRWFDNGTGIDPMVIEISNDNGATWTVIEDLTFDSDISGGWIAVTISIDDFVTPTDQMRVRFTASDFGAASIVEAGVDDVRIEAIDCDSVLLGDVNMDGIVNLLDVQDFVDLLTNGDFQAEADINGDGFVNLNDVSLFVDLLVG